MLQPDLKSQTDVLLLILYGPSFLFDHTVVRSWITGLPTIYGFRGEVPMSSVTY